MSAFLDMTAAQSASVAASVCDARLSARQKASKRRSQGRRSAAATAGIHGSIASVGAGLYKSFRERFKNSAASSAASSAVSDYRPLRQRDAEAGKLQNELNLSDSSDVESLQSSDSDSGSGSSVENLFGNETERGQWRKKKKPAVPRARRRKVSGQLNSLSRPLMRAAAAFHFTDSSTYLSIPISLAIVNSYARALSSLVCDLCFMTRIGLKLHELGLNWSLRS